MADTNHTRACTTCQQRKPATSGYFHANKRAPDGCCAVCKVCRAEDNAKSEDREKRLQQRREHYAANKDRIQADVKAYYQANIEVQRAAALARHYKNRDLRVVQMRETWAAKRDERNAARRETSPEKWRERYGADVEFTLRHRVRSLIRVSLTRGRKSQRMRDSLGYSVEELRAHLERQFTKGMTWERFMGGEIHIDHIVPVSSFNIQSDDSPEFRACWALSNLRPMWARENLSKGAKLTALI